MHSELHLRIAFPVYRKPLYISRRSRPQLGSCLFQWPTVAIGSFVLNSRLCSILATNLEVTIFFYFWQRSRPLHSRNPSFVQKRTGLGRQSCAREIPCDDGGPAARHESLRLRGPLASPMSHSAQYDRPEEAGSSPALGALGMTSSMERLNRSAEALRHPKSQSNRRQPCQ